MEYRFMFLQNCLVGIVVNGRVQCEEVWNDAPQNSLFTTHSSPPISSHDDGTSLSTVGRAGWGEEVWNDAPKNSIPSHPGGDRYNSSKLFGGDGCPRWGSGAV